MTNKHGCGHQTLGKHRPHKTTASHTKGQGPDCTPGPQGAQLSSPCPPCTSPRVRPEFSQHHSRGIPALGTPPPPPVPHLCAWMGPPAIATCPHFLPPRLHQHSPLSVPGLIGCTQRGWSPAQPLPRSHLPLSLLALQVPVQRVQILFQRANLM